MNKIFGLQKRAMRIISNSPYLHPTKLLFEEYKMLNIFDLYKKEAAIFMYKYKTGQLPSSFDGLFTINGYNHTYDTRKKEDFRIPMRKGKNIFTTGPKIWNDLPNDLKEAKNLTTFKLRVKKHLLGK